MASNFGAIIGEYGYRLIEVIEVVGFYFSIILEAYVSVCPILGFK